MKTVKTRKWIALSRFKCFYSNCVCVKDFCIYIYVPRKHPKHLVKFKMSRVLGKIKGKT